MENSIEKWRDYFSTANRDIFDVIENAIMVAAFDRQYDFKLKRDRIAEILFSCKLTKCDDLMKTPLIESGGSKESEIHSEIDEESQIVEEVLRIKLILDNSEEQSEALLLESLKGLQLMALSLEILKVTEIGKTVNGLRKHGSKQIQELVKTLIWDWKKMVDAWVDATQTQANAEIIEEEEEGAFCTTPVSVIEPSQFLDDMDDYGNLKKNRGFNNKNEFGKNPSPHSRALPLLKDKKSNRPIHRGPGKPKPSWQPMVKNENSKLENEALDKTRLESAKRKLHERYQEAENAKKRRAVQVVEFCDLPKESLVQRNNQQTRHKRR